MNKILFFADIVTVLKPGKKVCKANYFSSNAAAGIAVNLNYDPF